MRQERSAPLVAELEEWMRGERAKLSRHAPVAQAIDYMLKRWEGFSRFLADGRICLTNNAAERALRGLAISGSFCPCWAGSRGPLPLAPVFRTSASLREQRRARQRPDHSSGRRARACHYRSGLDDRSRSVRCNHSWRPPSQAILGGVRNILLSSHYARPDTKSLIVPPASSEYAQYRQP